MKFNTIAISAMISLLLCACDNNLPETTAESKDNKDNTETNVSTEEEILIPSDYTVINLSAESKAVADDCNHFGLQLVANVFSSSEPTQNVCIPTYGVFNTLAMLANGDDSFARDEVLSYIVAKSGSTISDVNAFCKSMQTALPTLDNATNISVASSFWYTKNYNIQSIFCNKLSDNFNAVINRCNDGKDLKSNLNAWIASQTDGTIEKFTDRDSLCAVAVNTFYIKGIWSQKFDPNQTLRMNFHNATGSLSDVEMMHDKALTTLYTYGSTKMISRAFGNSNYAMYIILPGEDESVSDAISHLSVGLESAESTFASIDLYLPKFKTDGNFNLIPTLRNMGFKSCTSPGFNSIFDNGNLVLNVLDTASVISIDENGCEAAAVAMAGLCGSPRPQMHTQMKCDRPFIYAIAETSTNTILLLGIIQNL